MSARRNLSPYRLFLELARNAEPAARFRPGLDPRTWQQATLPEVIATLGMVPAPVEPAAELVAEWTHGTVVHQQWVIDVEEGLAAVARVNVPADVGPGEARPAILCWHGHVAGGKAAIMGDVVDEDQTDLDLSGNYGQRMAQDGFVTFAIDWMGYGDHDDSAKPNHVHPPTGKDKCDVFYLHATMLGRTALGMNLAHGRVLVDFASQLPFVDADRIGVMGLSGGGTMALWSALTDARLRATEIVCYSDLFADFAYRDLNYCGSQITPGLYQLVDVPELQGLLAPRPLLVDIGAYDDCFRLDSAIACYQRVQQIYAAFGASEKLELSLEPAGHVWRGARSRKFFGTYLNHKTPNDIEVL